MLKINYCILEINVFPATMESSSKTHVDGCSGVQLYSGLTKEELQRFLVQALESKEYYGVMSTELLAKNLRLFETTRELYVALSGQREENRKLKVAMSTIETELNTLRQEYDHLETQSFGMKRCCRKSNSRCLQDVFYVI